MAKVYKPFEYLLNDMTTQKGSQFQTCKGKTKQGKSCRNKVKPDQTHCHIHKEQIFSNNKSARFIQQKQVAISIVTFLIALIGLTASLVELQVIPLKLWIERVTKMEGELNIAISEPYIVNISGERVNSNCGQNLANHIHGNLNDKLNLLRTEDLYSPIPEIRPPAAVAQIAGLNNEERQQRAKEVANKINAHILISGIITETAGKYYYQQEFFINSFGFKKASEIVEPFHLGAKIEINCDQAEFKTNNDIIRQDIFLARVILGLESYESGEFEQSLKYLHQALGEKEVTVCTEDDNKHVVGSTGDEVAYLLIANIWLIRQQDYNLFNLEQARCYYDYAIKVKGDYIRAKIGLSYALVTLAFGDLNTTYQIDTALLKEAENLVEEVSDHLDESPDEALRIKVIYARARIHSAYALVSSLNDSERFRHWLEAKELFGEVIILTEQPGYDHLLYLASDSHSKLGWAAEQDGLTNLAINHYKASRDLAPDYWKARSNFLLGDVYRENQKYQLAKDAYEACISWATTKEVENSCKLELEFVDLVLANGNSNRDE